ncbi:hypothetical protein B0T16DRAFT_234727 [Cercophora newfieldiana]|uniref:Zn(2)-C6 fungal-type domain-containing protein n=1 Tax=Cercophora newfieldiana TaxID=92897 RepID=A0AA39XRJ8_9PEZI|nr:hypothetical protein B0T16DRAFT_234727 [Cercophora newfieldiana]
MLNPDTPVPGEVPNRTPLYKSALQPNCLPPIALRAPKKTEEVVSPFELLVFPKSTMSEAMQYPSQRPSRAERTTTSCGECRRRKQKCNQGQPCSNCARRFPQPPCEYKSRHVLAMMSQSDSAVADRVPFVGDRVQ